jgi:stage II sporulation protein D
VLVAELNALLAKLAVVLALACLLSDSSPARALPESVRVRLFEAHPDLSSIDILSGCIWVDPPSPSAVPLNVAAAQQGLRIISGGRARPVIPQLVIKAQGKSIALRVNGKIRHYAGTITLRSAIDPATHKTVLKAINSVSTRDYVESSVGSELQPGWPAEVAKAQAVMTQTILARSKPGELLGDSTQRNVYLGADYVRPGTAEQVRSVWNQILTYDGRPAVPFWFSACAGRTSKGTDVFGSAADGMPYLQSVKCEFCQESPFWHETVTKIPQAKFAIIFGAQLPEFHGLDEAQRPLSVSYVVHGRKQTQSGYQFWTLLGQKFGWDKAPGLRFSLKQAGSDIIVTSTGAGHGVGLCGWGAAKQAREGKTYKQILQYYFPGTRVTSIAPH